MVKRGKKNVRNEEEREDETKEKKTLTNTSRSSSSLWFDSVIQKKKWNIEKEMRPMTIQYWKQDNVENERKEEYMLLK